MNGYRASLPVACCDKGSRIRLLQHSGKKPPAIVLVLTAFVDFVTVVAGVAAGTSALVALVAVFAFPYVGRIVASAVVDFAVVAPVAVAAVVAAIDTARSVGSDRCSRSPWQAHKTIQPV